MTREVASVPANASLEEMARDLRRPHATYR
jgi:hypothetical protein